MNEGIITDTVKLLKGNFNLILTGAPGTGKTYLAKKIAEAMGANKDTIKMVQFHPSYDYTDFVEGLRPIKKDKELGFERKDGVFKAFCKEALLSLFDEAIKKIYNNILNRVREGEKIEVRQQKGKTKVLSEITDGNLGWLRGEDATAKPDIATINKILEVFHKYPTRKAFSEISSSDIRNNVAGGDAVMIWTIANYLWEEIKRQGVNTYDDVSKTKPFVFIIDEINRGEISKIFGELFYSIDAGYRSIKGKVETQYQNLVPEDDVFSKGFYIPENVYIIGTMNDIDRSVESMDFAMRRRFAWKEITAESRQSMLDEDDTWKPYEKPAPNIIAEMKARMDNLNSAIIDQYGEKELSNKDKVGLTKAYQIGAAYFLKYALYNNFEDLWTNHLEGLLYEYLRGKTNIEEKIDRLHQAYNDTTTH